MVIDNPVNLRGSFDALPQEGSRAPEKSASFVVRVRASRARAVGAQPQRTGLIGGKSACAACGQRRQFIYGSRAVGGTSGGRFDRPVGRALQPGRSGSSGTAGRWTSTHPIWRRGTRSDSGGVSASAGSRAGRHGDLVIEHLAACPAACAGWPAQGQHVHTIWAVLHDAGITWQRDRTWCDTGLAIRKRKRGEVKVQDPDASAKKG